MMTSALLLTLLLAAPSEEGEVPPADQVRVQIVLARLSLTRLKADGDDLDELLGDDRIKIAQSEADRLFGPSREGFPRRVVDENDRLLHRVRSWRDDGLLEVVARPMLSTRVGRPAFLHVGGEFPLPVPAGNGTAVKFRRYGTQIDLVPTERNQRVVDLELRVRLSEIDPRRSVTVGELTVPGLIIREIDTGVRLRPDDVLVLRGPITTIPDERNGRSREEESAVLLLVRLR
jgi:hypothetical protein